MSTKKQYRLILLWNFTPEYGMSGLFTGTGTTMDRLMPANPWP